MTGRAPPPRRAELLIRLISLAAIAAIFALLVHEFFVALDLWLEIRTTRPTLW